DEGEAGPERGLVLPVYPATEGLTHRQVRGLIHQHLDALLALVADPHPKSLRVAVGLRELGPALGAVHRPETTADAEAGRRRLAFDELFDQQLVQARARALAKRARAGITFVLKKALTTKLKQHLPFDLTGDQRQAIREITDDMLAPLRMHRLLMGDVGRGRRWSRCSRCCSRSRTTTRRRSWRRPSSSRSSISRRSRACSSRSRSSPNCSSGGSPRRRRRGRASASRRARRASWSGPTRSSRRR